MIPVPHYQIMTKLSFSDTRKRAKATHSARPQHRISHFLTKLQPCKIDWLYFFPLRIKQEIHILHEQVLVLINCAQLNKKINNEESKRAFRAALIPVITLISFFTAKEELKVKYKEKKYKKETEKGRCVTVLRCDIYY